MKKLVFCFLICLSVGCVPASRIYDLRDYPTYRLGVVRAGWMDPSLRIDVWVNSCPPDNPSFTLLPGWQKEWTVESGDARVYARAWIWDNGQKLVVGETKAPLCAEVFKARDWSGYGWRIVLYASDFGLERKYSEWSRNHSYRFHW